MQYRLKHNFDCFMLQACAAIWNHHHEINYYGVEIDNIYLPPPNSKRQFIWSELSGADGFCLSTLVTIAVGGE